MLVIRLAWRWLRAHWVVYSVLAGLLLLVALLTELEQRVWVWFAIAGLAVCLLVVENVVRRARERDDDDPRQRSAFGAVLLIAGIVAIGVGLANVELVFFLGIASFVIAGGMLYSELRRSSWPNRARGPLLIAAALVLFVAAIVVPTGRIFVFVILAAALVGELGTELASEDSHALATDPGEVADAAGGRPEGRATSLSGALVASGGAVLLMIGFGLLVGVGADPVLAIVLLGVVGVFVLMATVASDSVLIVVLIAVALGVAIQPASETIADEATATEGEPYFVVLGDSYISGEGADQFLEGTNTKVLDRGEHLNECRQAATAWPFQLAARDDRPDNVARRLLFLACSGAVTENIHTEPRRAPGDRTIHGPAELALLAQRREDLNLGEPAFVLVSIGGNDAGFGEIGETCVGPGNCAEVAQQFLNDESRAAPPQPADGPPGKGRPEPLAAIGDDLDAAYDRIAAAIDDDVPVIAVPYPIPLAESARCRGVLLGDDERQFVTGFVRELNAVVQKAARRHGFLYLGDMEDALRAGGVPLCGSTGVPAGLNFIALNPKGGTVIDRLNPANWTHNSLHPNDDGHRALADAAARWFARNPDLVREVPNPGATHEVIPLKELMGGRIVVQCGDLPHCRVTGRHWLYDQAHELYARSVVPLALATLGCWLLILPVTWIARRRGWSVAALVRRTGIW